MKEPRGVAPCECGRIGYALFLCQEHAPIPYLLTDKGSRGVRHLRQWDVLEPVLIEGQRRRAAEHRDALAAGRRLTRATIQRPASR